MGYGQKSYAVVGYVYEADHHCIDCAAERFRDIGTAEPIDSEGNPVTPLFADHVWNMRYECEQVEGEEWHGVACGTCREVFAD